MKYCIPLILLLSYMTANAASIPSWSEFTKNNATEEYCATKLKKQDAIEKCEIEFIAMQRANRLCQNDSSPSYCLLMAESGWDSWKYAQLNYGKNKITKETAETYLIVCGYKEKNKTPCEKYSKPTN